MEGHEFKPSRTWRRRVAPTEDGRAMLAAFAASGQTASAFARAKGFSPHRVIYWRTKLVERQGPDAGSNSGFVHVAVRGDAVACQGATDRRGAGALAHRRGAR